MPSMPAYTPRRAEKRHRQLILLPRGHPLVGGEELGESRLTKLHGTHLAESPEHPCEVLLGLESTCNGYIEDACDFFYQQLLGSLHPCPQNKLVRSNSRRLMEHLREVCRAQQWTGQNVLWFTIISSAPGKQGYVTASEENQYLTKMRAAPTAALLDPSGEIGHLYDAKTSPQMVVINPQGIVIYDGAIDDRPTTDLNDVVGATNYVNLALEQAMAGKQVQTPATRPYGCSVKYPDSTG